VLLDSHRRPWRGFLFGQLLALAFIASCFFFTNHRILVSLSIQEQLGSMLGWQLLAFLGAAWLVHALLGAAAFALARLTEAALPARVSVGRAWLVAGWFAVLAGLALAANTTWHPSSMFAGEESWWRDSIAGLPPVALAGLTLLVVFLILAIRALPRMNLRQIRPAALAVAAVALATLTAALLPPLPRDSRAPPAMDMPNIVLIGIDSLRNDLEVPRQGMADTPHVRAFLSAARRFNDATSPLARTYPAWMSILTGRHPVSTNARFNLMPRGLVDEGQTLADALRDKGYRTVYSTDEVRFANIDQSFGFDELITPPIGAADFLLGYAGDIPLVNLVAATSGGGRLFPSNHANRAANVTYRPGHFVDRLASELTIDGPSFITIHLTLAHWPYVWAGQAVPTVPNDYRVAYGRAVAAVDRQFRDVLAVLEHKHVLDNAIVVLLSDHGEALGGDSDSMLRGTGTSREVWDSLWGHGTSVLSPNQYRVLLAMRAYGRAMLPGPELDYDWPVSLEDLRPTLEQLVIGEAPAAVDGISLLPYLAEPAAARALETRIRFTETDFNTPNTAAGRYEASGIIEEAAIYYELDRPSGWVQFREDRLPELLQRKQRAAISRDTLLAAIPGAPGQGSRYLLADRMNPAPRALEVPPDPVTDTGARRLWDALQARFPAELATDPASP
jgi:hypothetical protein